MIPAPLTPWVLAALSVAPGTPAPLSPPLFPGPLAPGSSPAPTPLSQSVHDISPPVDVFPYPPWMVATAIACGVVILGLLIWFLIAWIRRHPGPPPPTPAEIALRKLAELRARAGETEPYKFSVAVSDVLRTFIGDAKFRLPATRQTSPEFLAAISRSEMFTADDRALLGHFLEKCDLIKFARLQATSSDNTELVESALAFVQGGRA